MDIIDFFSYLISEFESGNAILKTSLLFLCVLLISRYIKNTFTKIIAFLGLNIFKNYDYLASFFHSRRMVNIAYYLLVVLALNYGAEFSSDTTTYTDNILYVINYAFTFYWLSSFLKHTVDFLETKDRFKDKPLLGFSQIIFVIFCVISIATIYAHFTNQSPKTLFTTLSVVSMAIFWTLKDIILGIISTILIVTNDIVKVGDWIENERFNADGKIIEISLVTVKVMNFDKTVSIIPTYSFIQEGFQNHQEILKSGKRLIKHVFRIEAESVRILSNEEVLKYRKIEILQSYIDEKMEKANHDITPESLDILNTNFFTNLGLFRKYVEKMVESNDMVFSEKNKKTRAEGEHVVIRITEGQKEGIGLQLYCFSKRTEWGEYNYLINQLSEKIYASAPLFGIKINN